MDSWLKDQPVASLFEAEDGPGAGDSDSRSRGALIEVRGVRLLDDGRVGAIVAWGEVSGSRESETVDDYRLTETNFHIFVEEDGRWLLDAEISGWRSATDGTAQPC